MKISSSNMKYWQSKGYSFDNPAPRWGIIPRIKVLVSELLSGSCVDVECKCDLCEETYTQRYSRNTDTCYTCRKSIQMKGNVAGRANKGRIMPNMQGTNHPRWNSNKDAQKAYYANVLRVTRLNDLSSLKNYDKPRGLCGQEGAYQLDHIISIKYGFDNNIAPELLGHINNLRFIPWQENRNKHMNINETQIKSVMSNIIATQTQIGEIY